MQEIICVTVAKRVASLRFDRGWSIRELSNRSGVDRATLTRIETIGEPGARRTYVTVDEVDELARAFGVPMSSLTGEAPAPTLAPQQECPRCSVPEGDMEREMRAMVAAAGDRVDRGQAALAFLVARRADQCDNDTKLVGLSRELRQIQAQIRRQIDLWEEEQPANGRGAGDGKYANLGAPA